MFRILLLAAALLATAHAERPNVLLICVDDLRPELKSYGAAHIHSPAMDSLASDGRAFTRHYVQAPTCGASRYALLTGRYAQHPRRDNDAIFRYAANAASEPPSLPLQFRRNGYRTVSIGKISHHPGGLGGMDWNDEQSPELPDAWDVHLMPTGPWKTPRAAMHGYANGEARKEKGTSPARQHLAGDDLTFTDGWITREALGQMESLAKGGQPFFLAVGINKPHLPFACPKSYLDLYEGVKLPPIPHPEKPAGLSTWHASGEFMKTYSHDGRDPRKDAAYADELRRSYAACVSYADAQVAKLLARLEELKLAENTIVVLWGDHGWHLGEHAIWGKHSLFEESLRSPLIVRMPGMALAGKACDAVVETVDIYPTLCELSAVPVPEGLSGDSLVARLKDPTGGGGAAISYQPRAETIRTPEHRLVRHSSPQKPAVFELYDHRTPEGETRNIAPENPALVRELNGLLDQQLKVK